MLGLNSSLDAILNRPRPSFFRLLYQDPFRTLAKWLCSQRTSSLERQRLRERLEDPTTAMQELAVVCVSDTHNSQPEIPYGDLFIHAGDLTQGGSVTELQTALNWINSLPHQHKIVIAGNHDMCLDSALHQSRHKIPTLNRGSIVYLQDTSVDLIFRVGRNLTVYGTPHTRKHGSWGFQFKSGLDVFRSTVPDTTDILVSHSPPRFHLDVDGFGDDNLLAEVQRSSLNFTFSDMCMKVMGQRS